MDDCIDHGMRGNADGYSLTWVGKKQQYRHRLVYANKVGISVYEIPKGMVVRHLCGNSRCINPDHLGVGTRSDNWYDYVQHTGKGFGESWYRSALTEGEVRDIKFLSPEMSSVELGEKYGVSVGHIRDIRSGNRWKHVTEQGVDSRYKLEELVSEIAEDV